MSSEKGLIVGEKWAVIHNGNYAVSDYGRVMRTSSKQGARPGMILSQLYSNKGYPRIAACFDGKRLENSIHTLVAREFIGPAPENLEVNHKDGNKRNNHWTNLEYVTKLENLHHARLTGLKEWKLTEDIVRKIRGDLALGHSQYKIAKEYGISQPHVSRIANRKMWKDSSERPSA